MGNISRDNLRTIRENDRPKMRYPYLVLARYNVAISANIATPALRHGAHRSPDKTVALQIWTRALGKAYGNIRVRVKYKEKVF